MAEHFFYDTQNLLMRAYQTRLLQLRGIYRAHPLAKHFHLFVCNKGQGNTSLVLETNVFGLEKMTGSTLL